MNDRHQYYTFLLRHDSYPLDESTVHGLGAAGNQEALDSRCIFRIQKKLVESFLINRTLIHRGSKAKTRSDKKSGE